MEGVIFLLVHLVSYLGRYVSPSIIPPLGPLEEEVYHECAKHPHTCSLFTAEPYY